jgi:hypothetical protein
MATLTPLLHSLARRLTPDALAYPVGKLLVSQPAQLYPHRGRALVQAAPARAYSPSRQTLRLAACTPARVDVSS